MSVEFRRRPAGDIWWNAAPIMDVSTALTVLCKDGNSNEPTHLRRERMDDVFVWEIVKPWYREGSSGGDSWGEDYYEVDSTIAEMLKAGELVEPHKILFMGGSTEERDRLVITSSAKEELFEYHRELRKTAKSFLVIGRHTDFTGEAEQGGSGREDNDTGRFYVDFKTPLDETCRVYPEQGEIVCPYPPPSIEEQAAA